MKDLKYWTYLVIEGHCAINWDYNSKHGKYVYQITNLNEPDKKFKFKKEPNPDYDPNIKRPVPPKFCKRKICYSCLANDCVHFACSDAGKDEGKVKVIEIKSDEHGSKKPRGVEKKSNQ